MRLPVHAIRSITLAMLMRTTKSLRVAVLGSGVAGSTVARTLADRGVSVTVFEAGRGIGGRTSTRITRDDGRYQFDHGCQYISKPKTSDFQDALDRWKRDGWVNDWSGNFGTAVEAPGEDRVSTTMEVDTEKKERWVGYPAMHSICRNLLHHKNIKVNLQTRADATYKEDQDSNWDLYHGKNKSKLGSFDWLIVTDRNSAAHFRKDLLSAGVDEFRQGVRGIKSVKSLTAMVVFESPLNVGLDGIVFDPKSTNGRFGALGWAARDTSKPGRNRVDGAECWVLQSHPAAADEMLKGMKKVGEIREKAKTLLLEDFLRSLPALSNNNQRTVPPVVHAVGHRWGAAFPIPSQQYVDMDSQVITDKRFVACGDYFGALSGRIEGAYLSGVSAADRVCQQTE